MSFSLFTRNVQPRARRPKVTRFALALEGLEDRTVMSTAAVAIHAAALPAAQVASAAGTTATVSNGLAVDLTSVHLTRITRGAHHTITGAVGTVTGTIAGHAFTAPLTLTSTGATTAGTSAQAAAVPVLNLMLGPIHLNLLGLKVDTSKICLSITAQPGNGNLLGNLVADVANLLNGPLTGSLSNLLGSITNSLNSVTTGAAATATGATGATTTTAAALPTSSILGLAGSALTQALQTATPSAASTNILNLSVAPVDLTLLGLNVHLDNCANGPITVKITAQRGRGNLLGNLLSDLSGLLNNPLGNATAITADLNSILGILASTASRR